MYPPRHSSSSCQRRERSEMSLTMTTTDLPPITLILQEVQTVTSAMRRNQRWASTSSSSFASSVPPLPPSLHTRPGGRKTKGEVINSRSRKSGEAVDEGDLMVGFVDLRRSLLDAKGLFTTLGARHLLTRCLDIASLPPLSLATPFLALIRSQLTSGPITSLSLASLHSLIISVLPLYFSPPSRTVVPSTPLQIALAHITATLSQCRFPSSSPQQDELVLLRLLRVIEALCVPLPLPSISSSVHWSLLDHMGDESVCELLEVGLGMLARARLSEGLRNSAQNCVQSITRAAFGRLKTLTKEDVDNLLAASKEAEEKQTKEIGENEDQGGKTDHPESHDGRSDVDMTLPNMSRCNSTIHAIWSPHDPRATASPHCAAQPFRPSTHRFDASLRPGGYQHCFGSGWIQSWRLARVARGCSR